MKIEEMPEDWSDEEKESLEKIDDRDLPADYKVDGNNIVDANGNIVGKVALPKEGSDEKPKYYLQKKEEPANLSFLDIYNIAKGLTEGGTNIETNEEMSADDVWNLYKSEDFFAKLSSSDITKIADLYNEEINQNLGQEDNTTNFFLDKAKECLLSETKDSKDENITYPASQDQYNEIVGAFVKESANNEDIKNDLIEEEPTS